MRIFDNLDLTALKNDESDNSLLSSLGLEEFGSGGKYHKYWEVFEDTTKSTVMNDQEKFNDQRSQQTKQIEQTYIPKSMEDLKKPNVIFGIVGVFAVLYFVVDLVRGK